MISIHLIFSHIFFSLSILQFKIFNSERMMRGDIKWPPEGTRQQMVNDEEEQKKIAEGPKFRPKKVHKVSNFFFQKPNNLTSI